MKSKYLSILSAALGILIGASITGVYLHQAYRKESQLWVGAFKERGDRWLYDSLMSSVLENVQTLTGLRRGKTEVVISLNEDRLSENLRDLILNYPAETLLSTNSIRTVKLAARYRAEHPYKTGTEEVDKVVEEFLAKVEDK